LKNQAFFAFFSSHIRKIITTQYHKTNLDVNSYIEKKHNVRITNNQKNPFVDIKNTTKEVSLQNVQFKMLHNIYPTAEHLHKWKLAESPNCAKCGEKETLLHVIYTCEVAKQTLINLTQIIEKYGKHIITLRDTDLITGIQGKIPIREAINCILILIKRKLVLQRTEKNS
jgi:hypothetical protein